MLKIINDLQALGMSELESQIYLVLHQESGLTGYRIARRLNKSMPNTYKALSSLESKGFVVSDQSHNARHYRTLPIREHLDSVERTFTELRKNVEDGLRELGVISQNEGIFRLREYTQVITKAKHLAQNAEQVLLVDVHPHILTEIKEDLEDAARRSVRVNLLVYDEVRITGCQHYLPHLGDTPTERWLSDWLEICADGEEFLLSHMVRGKKTVREALWSNNLHLGATVTARLGLEMILREIMLKALSGEHAQVLEDLYQKILKDVFYETGLISKYQSFVNPK